MLRSASPVRVGLSRLQRCTVPRHGAEAGQRGVTAAETGIDRADADRGSAVVEFVVLAVLLLVPVVYFVITMGVLQGATYAAVGAADHAAKVFATAPDAASGRMRAEEAVQVAVSDFGMETGRATMTVTCSRADCLEAGSAVTVAVAIEAPLPLVAAWGERGLAAGRVEASATQIVGRYR